MTPFLKQIAEDIIDNYTIKEYKELLIIVPSRRVGLYLKKEMATLLKQTFWSPVIKTIDEFLTDKHKSGVVDSVTVHFELYKAYVQIFGKEETFDSFQSWSSQILNDFNEIDRYLLSHKEVFSNLKDIKEIEQWSFNKEDLSENQNKFLIFWEKLGELYEVFSNQLAKQNLATSAKVYRDIAANPKKYLNDLPYKKTYILGFNALSTSEEEIFKHLYQTSQAKIYWDADQYYLKNKLYEAGNFIRRYKWASESIKEVESNLVGQEKKIHLYPSKTSIDQVNIAAKIMEENPAFSNDKSALILSDETLLNPLVNAIPLGVDKMNITMGYSIGNTLAKELFETCLDVIISSQRFSKGKMKSIYFKDLDNLFENALFKQFTNNKKDEFVKLRSSIIKYNYTFITPKNLTYFLGDYSSNLDFLFYDNNKSIESYLEDIALFIQKVRSKLIQEDELNIEIEALYKIEQIIAKVQTILKKYPYITTLSGLRKLIWQILGKEKLSFYGEPLQGLQIMGFLETRALDFENVILLSCNESFLPGVAPSNSLIPFDLKLFLKLPTKSDREAIFAYYFYRIIQRAKNIHLVYNNGISNQLESNEISRYIIQLENELSHYENITITSHQINYKIDNTPTAQLIDKDELTLSKIEIFLKNGLSPSALNGYLACPLDFYYKYVLRIREQEEVEESIESSTQGTIIHKVLENLYTQFGSIINTESIDEMLKVYKNETDLIFKEAFPQGNYKTGKNLLTFSMALKGIRKFLMSEKEFIAKNGHLKILGLEENLSHTLKIETPTKTLEVLLKGNADRIDLVGNTIRIIDYKTGFVQQTDVVTNFYKILEHPKANQLMFYAYLYYKQHNKINIESGIVSFRNLNGGLLNLIVKEEKQAVEFSSELFDEYEDLLIEQIQEIYNSEINFEHNSDAKYCMICEM